MASLAYISVRIGLSAALFAAAAACSSDPVAPVPSEDVRIRLHVTGGLAGVDYALVVDGATLSVSQSGGLWEAARPGASGPGAAASGDYCAGTAMLAGRYAPGVRGFLITDEIDLTQATSAELDHIRSVLRDGKYAGKPIDVVGHTDSDPIRKTKNQWKDNWELSAERALSVARYLIQKGIDDEDIRAVGCGASRPVASNSSSSGKAKNRRVEIVVGELL